MRLDPPPRSRIFNLSYSGCL